MLRNHFLKLKKMSFVAGIALCLLLAGCKEASESEPQTSSKPQSSSQPDQTVVFAQPEEVTSLTQVTEVLSFDKGVYTTEEQSDGVTSLLTYYDRETATSHVLCQREGCTHDTEECPALYHQWGSGGIFCYQDCLYLVEPDLTQQTPGFTLYRCDLDGDNKSVALTWEDVDPPFQDRSFAGIYYDGLALYLTYLTYGTDPQLDILKISLTNNPKMDHGLQYQWNSAPEVKPVIRWFGPVVDGRILLRNSMEELLLLDVNTLERETLRLDMEGWFLNTAWDEQGIYSQYDYGQGCWTFQKVDLFTGESLARIYAVGFGLEYAPETRPELKMALLCDAYKFWLINWDRTGITELPLVRWQGDEEITILPIAQCGDEYLVRLRDELYSSFRIDASGALNSDPVYRAQYAFISVEDYLAGQPNYRIIQKAG